MNKENLNRKGTISIVIGIIGIALLASGIAITGFLSNPDLIRESSPSPIILNASVYPEKIKDGEVLLITALVEEAENVTANIKHEKGSDLVDLVLVEGDNKKGTYQGAWVAHDLKNQEWYNIAITATNQLGSSFAALQFQDPTVSHPASEITAGTFDSGDFVFPNNLQINENLTVDNIYLTNASDWLIDTSTGLIKEDVLPYCKGDLTSDVYTQCNPGSCDVGNCDNYYNVSNLVVGNVKSGITFGRGQTGTLSPSGTATAGDVCDSKTFYSGDSWTQKSGTRVASDCGYIPDTWSGVCIYKTGDVSCPSEYPTKHTRQVCTACTSCTGSCKGCNSCSGSPTGGWIKRGYSCGATTWTSCTGYGCCTQTCDDGSGCSRWFGGVSCTGCTGSCKGCNSCTGSPTSCTTYTYCCQ